MCKNLINFLSSIGKDKYIHYTACLLIALFLFAIGHALRLGNWFAGVAFIVALLAGFLKEKSDQKKTGYFEHNDFVADFLGAFTAIVLMAIILI